MKKFLGLETIIPMFPHLGGLNVGPIRVLSPGFQSIRPQVACPGIRKLS